LKRFLSSLLPLTALLIVPIGRADSTPAPATSASAKELDPTDEKIVQARALFADGLLLSKKMQWNDALIAFEKSRALRSHAATSFNVGYCQRALGRYIDARINFARALAENAANGFTQLPDSTVEEIKSYLTEISTLLVKVTLKITPKNTKVLLDGRPVVPSNEKDAPPGTPRYDDHGGIIVEVNPGIHVLHLSAKGFSDVLLNKSWTAGSTVEVPVDLAQLPSKLHVEADVPNAFVRIDGKDVGVTPVDTERPAGEHRIEVEKPGYVTYATTVRTDPGGRADLKARLVVENVAITKRWWFWTGIAAVVGGGVGATYLLTRPEREPPPYDGGRLGWVAPGN
jgi:hypothetical protein